MSSDVAALRQQIETECAAIHQALYGFAVVSRHDIISRRYETLDHHRGHLATVVGESEALRITYQAYAQAVEADG